MPDFFNNKFFYTANRVFALLAHVTQLRILQGLHMSMSLLGTHVAHYVEYKQIAIHIAPRYEYRAI